MKNNRQSTHADYIATHKKFPLSIVANDIASALNVGGLFRLCDALGIKTLHLCGDTPTPPNSKINKTSRSTEKYIHYEINEDAEVLVKELKTAGILIIALEITSTSIAINTGEFKSQLAGNPSCLILGSENTGISQSLLALADITVHIPMVGSNSSMNVVAAANIASYEITNNYLTKSL